MDRRFRLQALRTALGGRPSVAAVMAGMLLAAGLVLPWFQVPDAISSDVRKGFVVVGREAPVTGLFKALCLAAVGIGAVRLARARGPVVGRIVIAKIAAALLVALLFFPHMVMVWCPVTSAKASWLHVQHESLTWFGGDVFGLPEIKDFAWKSRVYAADMLDQATAMNLPAWSPNAVPFGSLQDLFEWFGYSNPFCQFVCAGWGSAIMGCIVALIASFRTSNGADVAAIRASARAGAGVLVGAVTLALVPAAVCGWQLQRARSAIERGQIALGLDRIRTAVQVLPIAGQSSDLRLQEGLLEGRLGLLSPEVALYRAKLLEAHGASEEAVIVVASLLAPGASEGAVRREASRAMLRTGIRELNSGEVGAAIKSLESVLLVEPCNVKANYVLQLAYLRDARFESLRQLAARMRDTYRYFSTDTKLPILAATQENVAYAWYLEGDPGRAHSAWKLLSDPKALKDL